MSEAPLSEGQGTCVCSHVVTFTVDREALRAGAGPTAMRNVMSAVHRINRHSTDRIAVSFPDHDGSAGFEGVGAVFRAWGTEALLGDLVGAVSSGRASKGLLISGIQAVTATEGAAATVFYRSRRGEKGSPAGLARAKARVERRGGTWSGRPHRGKGHEKGLGFFDAGDVRVFFGVKAAVYKGSVSVNTYGLSPSGSEGGLPEIAKSVA